MLVTECPRCGNYSTQQDGREDTFVEEVVCARCRDRDREFDDGFAEYEETQRVDPFEREASS